MSTVTDVREDLTADLGTLLSCHATQGCDRPAAWLGTAVHEHSASCATYPFCDSCRNRYLRRVIEIADLGGRLVCKPHARNIFTTWRPL